MTPREGSQRGTGVVHAVCRWIVGAAASVVPRDRRAAWRAEWEAEVWHHLRGGGGRGDSPPDLSVLRRCLGAFRHALWLRREQLILASREGMTMKGLWNDVRHAVRGLARAPMFTATTVGTLGLGLGAVVAIFTVLHGVLLDPLPFEEPDELVSVWHTAPGWGFDEVPVALTQWATYREESRTLDQIGLWAAQPVTITGIGEPERVSAVGVTWELLPLLGVEPVLGRRFSAEADAPGAAETVLLGHGYWTRAFGADPAVLGTTLRVSGRSREVIGVLPAGFGLPGEEPDILFPFQFDRENVVLGGFNYQAIARLSAGASLESAAADVARMIRLVPELHGGTPLPILEAAGFAPNLRTLERDFVGDVGRTLWVLLGTVGIVLLIACANVANLFLVRAEGRQPEVSLRAALGAARSRIARHFLVESLALAMVGGLLGTALAYVGTRLLVSSGPADLPRLSNIAVGPEALVIALALAVASGLAFGLLPLAHTSRAGLMASLKEGGRGAVAGGARVRARDVLVVLQVAMALVLLTASGLMIRSFQALRDVDPGFGHAEDVVTFRLAVPEVEIGPNDTLRLRQL